MPISVDEFKKRESRSSREEIVYQILSDGKAHSIYELADEVRIIKPKTENLVDLYLYFEDLKSFGQTLDSMEKDGRIVNRIISVKDGGRVRYSMRKDFVK